MLTQQISCKQHIANGTKILRIYERTNIHERTHRRKRSNKIPNSSKIQANAYITLISSAFTE